MSCQSENTVRAPQTQDNLPFPKNEPPAKNNVRRAPDFFKKNPPKILPTLKPGRYFNAAVQESIDFLAENGKKTSAKLANGLLESELMSMLLTVQNGVCLDPLFLEKYVDFYELQTTNLDNKTRMTGYFTPILTARKTRNREFSTPIYKNPSEVISLLPSRQSIEKGILSGKNLEIGWLRNQKELRSLQMQGSGFLKFEDGALNLVGWSGTNQLGKNEQMEGPDFTEAHAEKSPDLAQKKDIKTTKLRSKSTKDAFNYVFFKSLKSRPMGAMSAELTPSISVSVDPRIVPLGSVLLAELRSFSGAGNAPKYQILLAQDVGGGIQGSERMDIYCGAGQAFSPIFPINDFAKIWLMLPK